MNKKFRAFIVALPILIFTPTFADSKSSSNKEQIKIIAITMDSKAVPFILDNKGDVWAFEKPLVFQKVIKLANLHHIKKLLPYMALTEDGHVYTWAMSKQSQYLSPQELIAQYTEPKLIKELTNVTDIDSYGEYFAALVNDSNLYEWGSKTIYNKKYNTTKPELVYAHPNIRSISTSGHSTIALLNDNKVVGWGYNYQAQLGVEGPQADIPVASAVFFTAPESIKKIYISAYHSIALSENGDVYFWGSCLQKNGLKADGIKAELSAIDDVAMVVVNGFDDNIIPNTFLKNNGSVWLAYAPLPKNTEQCQSINPVYDYKGSSTYHLEGMAVKAVAIAAGGDGESKYSTVALGEDNKLWGANMRHPEKGFEEIPVKF